MPLWPKNVDITECGMTGQRRQAPLFSMSDTVCIEKCHTVMTTATPLFSKSDTDTNNIHTVITTATLLFSKSDADTDNIHTVMTTATLLSSKSDTGVKQILLYQCCWVLLYVHRNRRLIRDRSPGQPPRLSHSSWTLFTGVKQIILYWCQTHHPLPVSNKSSFFNLTTQSAVYSRQLVIAYSLTWWPYL